MTHSPDFGAGRQKSAENRRRLLDCVSTDLVPDFSTLADEDPVTDPTMAPSQPSSCIKTATLRITQTMPYNNPGIRVF